MMGKAVSIEAVEAIDTIIYELYRVPDEGKGIVHVMDEDTGDTYTTRLFPTFEAARESYWDAIAAAKGKAAGGK